jgi:hypothetical protein
VRDGGVVPAQVAEAFGALLQVVDQQAGPAAADDLHHFLDGTAGDEIFHPITRGYKKVRHLLGRAIRRFPATLRSVISRNHGEQTMEPILVYGFPAGSSMGLVAALEWLGKPYSLCRVDMLGEMRDASYARINARHETPVLITDAGRALTETMAIAAWFEAETASGASVLRRFRRKRPDAPADGLC